MADVRENADARTPRWVKVFGGISLVVIVVFIVLLLLGGGQHGPSRHLKPPASPPVKSDR